MDDVKRIDVKEFRAKGFLQEVNRKFFHPLGLALEVLINDETGEESLGGVWDYKDDKEGMFFQEKTIFHSGKSSKIEYRKTNKYENIEVDKNGVQIG